MKKEIPQRTRCLIQGCLYGLPFKKPKKYCMFCGVPRDDTGIYCDAITEDKPFPIEPLNLANTTTSRNELRETEKEIMIEIEGGI